MSSDPMRVVCVWCERMRINHLGPQQYCTTLARHTFKAARSAKPIPTPKVKVVPVPELNDFRGTLAKLKIAVDTLILAHGDQATVEFTVGSEAPLVEMNVLITRR